MIRISRCTPPGIMKCFRHVLILFSPKTIILRLFLKLAPAELGARCCPTGTTWLTYHFTHDQTRLYA